MVTLHDVAVKAGVGVSTVSYVLNETGLNKVSPRTQERILAAARELRYVPNVAGKALRKGITYTVAVLFPEIYGSFAFNILSGLESELNRENYSMLFCRYHDCAEFIAKCRSFAGRQIDAVIVLGGYPESVEALAELNKRHPVISLATKNPLPGMPSVYVRGAKHVAVKHLEQLGHKHIAVHCGFNEETIDIARQTFQDVRAELFICPKEVKSGKDFLDWGLSLNKRITAFSAYSDIMAIELMGTAIDRGVRIPQDISVVGIDGEDIGEFFRPALTTVRQPDIEQGVAAARLMLEVVRNGAGEDMILMPELLLRNSTAVIK